MPGNQYPLVQAGGAGMSKAMERELRGPTLLGAQGTRNAASEATIGRVGDRNEAMAAQEYGVALDQERQARAREAATAQSQAEQAEEMQQRQADFDSTVQQLGKMGQIDQSRWWASRSTGQKIAGIVELMVSGFTGAQSMVMKSIDNDIKAQEFAYYATRDTANAKQTAFSMAMQKYQNADAARAVARAAAIDVTQAQLAQVGAKWKGTDAANKADMAMAALQDEKMMQIANGIQFVPSQYVGRRFMDPRTGLIYSEAEAKAMSAKVDERDFENRKQVADTGGKLMVADVNNQAEMLKAGQQAQGQQVALPNGDTVRAPSTEEASKLRGLAASVNTTRRLVNEAIQIRSDPTFRADRSARARLEQIQAHLTVQFKNQAELGALSKDDYTLSKEGTANLFDLGSSVESRLRHVQSISEGAVTDRVKTYADAPATAKGELPADAAADFKAYGGKK
jgi:hypothetical protein